VSDLLPTYIVDTDSIAAMDVTRLAAEEELLARRYNTVVVPHPDTLVLENQAVLEVLGVVIALCLRGVDELIERGVRMTLR
jgi:hypothetical protein